MKKTFLNELLHNGLIDEDESLVNKKWKVYFPIVDLADYEETQNDEESLSFLSNLGPFDKDSQQIKLLPPKIHKNIPQSWLELQILFIIQYRMGEDKSQELAKYFNNKESIDMTLEIGEDIDISDFKLLDKDGIVYAFIPSKITIFRPP